jgi:hypothetical protein
MSTRIGAGLALSRFPSLKKRGKGRFSEALASQKHLKKIPLESPFFKG